MTLDEEERTYVLNRIRILAESMHEYVERQMEPAYKRIDKLEKKIKVLIEGIVKLDEVLQV